MKKAFLLIVLLMLCVNTQAQTRGKGKATDLSQGITRVIDWERYFKTEGNVFGTNYSFYLPGAGNAELVIMNNKQIDEISYEIVIKEVVVTARTYKLTDFEEKGNSLVIKNNGQYAGFYMLEVKFLSSKKESLKVVTAMTEDFLSLLIKLDK